MGPTRTEIICTMPSTCNLTHPTLPLPAFFATHAMWTTGFAALIHKDFYVPPVELEVEPGYGFLGVELDPDQFATHYTRQIQLSDVPSPHSATTSTVLHSGMRARLHKAPLQRRKLLCMKGRYLAAGHDPRMIQGA